MKKLILLFLCLFLVSCSSTLPDMGWLIEENKAAYEKDAYGGEEEQESGILLKESAEMPVYEELMPKDWTGPTLVWSMMDIVPRDGVPFPFEALNAYLEKTKAPYRISLLKIKTSDREAMGKIYGDRLLAVLDEKKVDIIHLGFKKRDVGDELVIVELLEKKLLEELPDDLSPFSKELYYENKLYTVGNPRIGNKVGVFIPDTRDLVGEFRDVQESLELIKEHKYTATFEVRAIELLRKLPIGHFFIMEEGPVFFWESHEYQGLAETVEELWEERLLSTENIQADLFFTSGFSGDVQHHLSEKMGKLIPFSFLPRQSDWYVSSENAIYVGSKNKEFALDFLRKLYNDKELAKVFSLSENPELISEFQLFLLPTTSLFNEHLLAKDGFLKAIKTRPLEERGFILDEEIERKLTALYEDVQTIFPEDWEKLLYMKEGWKESAEKISTYLKEKGVDEIRDEIKIEYGKQRREKS